MSASATFSLAVVLSAMNRTGGAFGAVEQAAGKLKGAFARTSAAANELFTMGNTMSAGFTGWLLKQGMVAEDTAMNMQTLLNGNKAAADELVSQTKAVFAATKVGSSAALENAQSLLAFGLAKEKVVPVMQQLGDLALGNATKFNQLADNYGKMVSAQHVSIIDLRQFSLAGAPVIEELQKITGKAGAEFDKMVSDGGISVAMVEDAFARMTGEGGRFNNAMANAATTASGRLNIALASLSKTATDLSISLLPVVTGLLNMAIPVADAIGRMAQDFPKLSAGIAGVVAASAGLNIGFKILGVGGAFVKDIYAAGVSVANFTRALKALRAAEAAGNMAQWYSALERYGGAGNLAAKALRYARIEQIGFNRATLANPYILAAAALAALTVGIGVYLAKKKEMSAAEQMEEAAGKAALEQAAQKKASLREELDNIANLKEGTVEYNAALSRLQANYGAYVRDLDLSKATKEELPELSKKIAAGIDLEAKALALARLKSEQYYEAEKARMEAASIKNNWADDAMMQTFAGGLLTKFFGNTQKRNEAAERYATGRENIAAINEMQQSNNAEIRLTTNVVLDGKVVGSTVNNVNRIDNRGSYE